VSESGGSRQSHVLNLRTGASTASTDAAETLEV
jgi:hypothetical protein